MHSNLVIVWELMTIYCLCIFLIYVIHQLLALMPHKDEAFVEQEAIGRQLAQLYLIEHLELLVPNRQLISSMRALTISRYEPFVLLGHVFVYFIEIDG